MKNSSKKIVSENFKLLRKNKFGNTRFPKELVSKFHQGTIQRLEEQDTDFGLNLLDDVAQYFGVETYTLLIEKNMDNKKFTHQRNKINKLVILCEQINDDGIDFLISSTEGLIKNYPINKKKQTA